MVRVYLRTLRRGPPYPERHWRAYNGFSLKWLSLCVTDNHPSDYRQDRIVVVPADRKIRA